MVAYSDCCCCCSNCIYHIMFYRLALFLALGFCFWKWINSTCSLDQNHDCNIGTEKTSGNISHFLAYSRKLGNRRSSEGLQSFKPSKGTNLLTQIHGYLDTESTLVYIQLFIRFRILSSSESSGRIVTNYTEAVRLKNKYFVWS